MNQACDSASTTEAIVYVDGIAGAVVPLSGYGPNTTRPLYLGRDPAFCNRYFRGLLDEISIYNRPVSATEVLVIYEAGSSGKCLAAPYITGVTKSGRDLGVAWTARHGISYCLQCKTTLTNNDWNDIPGDVTANSSSAAKSSSLPANPLPRFYRVQALR